MGGPVARYELDVADIGDATDDHTFRIDVKPRMNRSARKKL